MTRPFLQEKPCKDPNPHAPHKWDRLGDPFVDVVDPRFWCRGVDEVRGPVLDAVLGRRIEPRRPACVVYDPDPTEID